MTTLERHRSTINGWVSLVTGAPQVNPPDSGAGGVDWSESNPPWALEPGESVKDNMPSGVTVVNVEDYSTSDDIYTALMAVTNGVTGHVYVQLQARTYYITQFRDYGAGQYLGHANSNRRIMGIIGHGVAQTKIRVQPTAISSSPGAMEYVLNATGLGTSGGGPILLTALYWSNTNSTVPLFISGIDFQGTLQTPFSTYSTASQQHFRRNHAVPSPLAWNGMAVWRSIPGARIQFCKFTGFAFALNSAPPFECGALGNSWNNGLVTTRVEIDGRIPAEVDPARPRASGSIMWNKELDNQLKDVWMHHTRRSGWATNTNTNNQGETYRGTNVKAEEIANHMDGWAGDNGFFNGSNVEEVIGTFTYENVHLNVADGHHINWAVPYSNANGIVPVPSHAVFHLTGFTTDDPDYGGCLRIKVSRNPNSTGQSRVWERVNAVGPAASGFFNIRRADGTPLTPVRDSQWNSSMTPDTHFVVNY